MIINNILLIVEGEKDEKNIFNYVFKQYGFNPTIIEEKFDVVGLGTFEKYQYSLKSSNIVIIQGPKSRIHDFLNLIVDPNTSIEKVFSYSYAHFTGIFLIYDVDHNDCDDISQMYDRFADETTGLLLLSSPCIEVLGDYNRNRIEERYCHLKEYKKDINEHYCGKTFDYIKNNFSRIMCYFLKKNKDDFNENNVMEHPRLIIEKINSNNIRTNFAEKEKSFVIYRYFSTVVYVVIAYAKGLTINVDNYDDILNFFDTH